MTRDEHRAEALSLLGLAGGVTPPAHPQRLAYIAEAQLHATLALSAPETKTTARKRTATAKVAESKETTK